MANKGFGKVQKIATTVWVESTMGKTPASNQNLVFYRGVKSKKDFYFDYETLLDVYQIADGEEGLENIKVYDLKVSGTGENVKGLKSKAYHQLMMVAENSSNSTGRMRANKDMNNLVSSGMKEIGMTHGEYSEISDGKAKFSMKDKNNRTLHEITVVNDEKNKCVINFIQFLSHPFFTEKHGKFYLNIARVAADRIRTLPDNHYIALYIVILLAGMIERQPMLDELDFFPPFFLMLVSEFSVDRQELIYRIMMNDSDEKVPDSITQMILTDLLEAGGGETVKRLDENGNLGTFLSKESLQAVEPYYQGGGILTSELINALTELEEENRRKNG